MPHVPCAVSYTDGVGTGGGEGAGAWWLQKITCTFTLASILYSRYFSGGGGGGGGGGGKLRGFCG